MTDTPNTEPMTKLESWMKPKGYDDGWLAERLNVDRTSAWRIRRGRMRPNAERAFLIEDMTKKKVTARELLLGPLVGS